MDTTQSAINSKEKELIEVSGSTDSNKQKQSQAELKLRALKQHVITENLKIENIHRRMAADLKIAHSNKRQKELDDEMLHKAKVQVEQNTLIAKRAFDAANAVRSKLDMP